MKHANWFLTIILVYIGKSREIYIVALWRSKTYIHKTAERIHEMAKNQERWHVHHYFQCHQMRFYYV